MGTSSTFSRYAVTTSIMTAVIIGCASGAPDTDEEPLGVQRSAVVQPPQSERDKCHGAPSCVAPRNTPGCRVKGECIPRCTPPEIPAQCGIRLVAGAPVPSDCCNPSPDIFTGVNYLDACGTVAVATCPDGYRDTGLNTTGGFFFYDPARPCCPSSDLVPPGCVAAIETHRECWIHLSPSP